MQLPQIPDRFFSLLGALPVERIDEAAAKADEKFGEFHATTRTIDLAAGHPVIEWMTLWHEAVHSALFDCGVNNIITDEQCEVVCDALGTYLTAMMLAGELQLPGQHTNAAG